MEISQDLQDFILTNGSLVLNINKYNTINFNIEVVIDKKNYNQYIEELDNIIKYYDISIFPNNFGINIGNFKNGIVSNVKSTTSSKIYTIYFNKKDLYKHKIYFKLKDIKVEVE